MTFRRCGRTEGDAFLRPEFPPRGILLFLLFTCLEARMPGVWWTVPRQAGHVHEREGRALSRRGAVGYLGAQGEARLLGCISVGIWSLGEDFCLGRREGKPGVGSGGPHPSSKAEAGHGVDAFLGG